MVLGSASAESPPPQLFSSGVSKGAQQSLETRRGRTGVGWLMTMLKEGRKEGKVQRSKESQVHRSKKKKLKC